jgi:hypothetical protein
MRAGIGVSAVVLTAAITVAACSDNGGEPSTLPDATPASSAVVTETAIPTGDPTAQLEAEITDFYKLYVETINMSWTSEEALQRRREMFADTCATCLAGYELARHAVEEGLTFEAEPASVRTARLDGLDGDVATFLGIEDVPAGRLLNSDGEVVDEFGATLGAQVVYRVQRGGAGWVVIASDLLSVEGGG